MTTPTVTIKRKPKVAPGEIRETSPEPIPEIVIETKPTALPRTTKGYVIIDSI